MPVPSIDYRRNRINQERMGKTLHVLIVEDVESDASLIIRYLQKEYPAVVHERIMNAVQMKTALEKKAWDVVISDYRLPQFDAPSALKLLKDTGLDIPFIVVSGTIGEETAVGMMKAGAQDYMMKDNLLRLTPAVTRELADAEVRKQQKITEKGLRRGYDELMTIYTASQKLLQLTTPDVLMAELVRIMEETLNYTYGAILLIDERTGKLIPFSLSALGRDKAFVEQDLKFIQSLDLDPGEGITGWVALSGETLKIDDVMKDPRYRMVRKDVAAELCVPLKVKDKILGVLNIESVTPNAYSDSDIRVMEVMAALMAIAIENSHLLQRIQAELKVRIEAEKKAEESNMMKSALMMNMSHEIRTPMNAILGFSDLISDESNEEEVRHMAERIRVSGDRLMKTLDDILELTELQSGVELKDMTETDIGQLLKKIIGKYEVTAYRKKIDMSFQSDAMVKTFTDKRLFEKAVSEIVNNAIKFTNEGSVHIQLSKFTSMDQSGFEVRVKDTGIGIARENHQIIFDSFRQLSSGYGRSYEGSGLGLTIAKRIIGLLNGEILVESEPGHGATFIIRMPGRPDPLKNIGKRQGDIDISEAKKEPGLFRGPGKLQILLVEDNEDNVIVTRQFCQETAVIDGAPDGLQAIQMAKTKKYDAILMDIHLGPGIDGLETVRLIRKIPGYEGVPVVALTGYTLRKDKDRFLAHGCTCHLAKPYSREMILDLIEKLF